MYGTSRAFPAEDEVTDPIEDTHAPADDLIQGATGEAGYGPAMARVQPVLGD
jgi:hypothetical protein